MDYVKYIEYVLCSELYCLAYASDCLMCILMATNVYQYCKCYNVLCGNFEF